MIQTCRVLSRYANYGHCFLLRNIASFYRSEAIIQGMLLLSSDKISINCACTTAVSKLRQWYGKKRDAIYSCTMINTVKSVMLTCKKTCQLDIQSLLIVFIEIDQCLRVNTVFILKKMVYISHIRKINNAPVSVSALEYHTKL